MYFPVSHTVGIHFILKFVGRRLGYLYRASGLLYHPDITRAAGVKQPGRIIENSPYRRGDGGLVKYPADTLYTSGFLIGGAVVKIQTLLHGRERYCGM